MESIKEEWRPVVGYEGLYEVSNLGRVRSVERIITDKNGRKMHYYGKLLSQGKTTNGYDFVLLGQKNNKLTHILVAKSFLPNPYNKPEVDHIIPISDGGTNEVWNLRWVTASENARNPLSMKKRYRKLSEEAKKKISEARKGKHYPKLSEAKKGKKNQKLSEALKGRKNESCRKKVLQFSKDGSFIREWDCIADANKELNIRSGSISAVCKGKLKTTGGYKWKYSSI